MKHPTRAADEPCRCGHQYSQHYKRLQACKAAGCYCQSFAQVDWPITTEVPDEARAVALSDRAAILEAALYERGIIVAADGTVTESATAVGGFR